jgi:hypothetical protein
VRLIEKIRLNENDGYLSSDRPFCESLDSSFARSMISIVFTSLDCINPALKVRLLGYSQINGEVVVVDVVVIVVVGTVRVVVDAVVGTVRVVVDAVVGTVRVVVDAVVGTVRVVVDDVVGTVEVVAVVADTVVLEVVPDVG